MTPDIEVDAAALRRCAAALADTAAQVHSGPAGSPPLAVVGHGWATGAAAAVLQAATEGRLAALSDRIALTGRQVAASADGYDAADDRAAARLRTAW